MWADKRGLSLWLVAQMRRCFVELEKEAALVVVIGLGKGHPGTGLYVGLLRCQNSLKYSSYNTHDSIF